ncbi:MAG: hypothetical protein GY798_07085 [Hyphomicrobiales bacterium]|nr:hypothetical protein [Hyphomicrobiales bacterium]
MQTTDPIRRVADRWDAHLARIGQPDVDRLYREQQERSLQVHGRPVCTVARPHFVGEEELIRHRHAVKVLADGLVKARDHIVADRKREAEHLGRFYDWIGDLMHLEPAGADHGAITRLDSFRSATGLHFIELNADAPGGAGHNDGLAAAFASLDTYSAVAGEFDLQPLLLQPAAGRALIEAWRDWGGDRPPVLAAVGWFERIGWTVESVTRDLEYFRDAGIADVIAVGPDALEFDGRRLSAGGVEIDLVYRLMLTRDVLAARDEVKPLLTALRHNAVCMVNPFRAELMGHKALFALLTDPDVPLGLDSVERKVIRDHVPWGRLLRESSTLDPQGRRVDLVEYVIANRDELVLKPTHEAMGKGVELGWHHGASSWESVVRTAIDDDYIVQMRIPTERVAYPAAEPGIPARAMYEDMDPFVTRGQLAGFLTRLSEAEIVNVARGGSVVPTFVARQ